MPAQLQIVQTVNRSMQCSSCGAAGIAACDCGAPYVPAATRAAKAIAANPNKSDRAIAADLGVDHKTVGKARKSTGDYSPVETRTGKDGVTRVIPKRKAKAEEEDIPSEEEAEACYQEHLYKIFIQNLDDMTAETRRKLFAHIRRKYGEKL
jgi:hypothetical protein